MDSKLQTVSLDCIISVLEQKIMKLCATRHMLRASPRSFKTMLATVSQEREFQTCAVAVIIRQWNASNLNTVGLLWPPAKIWKYKLCWKHSLAWGYSCAVACLARENRYQESLKPLLQKKRIWLSKVIIAVLWSVYLWISQLLLSHRINKLEQNLSIHKLQYQYQDVAS